MKGSRSDARLFELKRHDDLSISVGSNEVAATRYEPIGSREPLPAVLMVIPYHKDDYITYGNYDPSLQYIARHGYEVVFADLVGTGASSGTKEKSYEPTEADEVVEIIEWLADREWTNGSVGMFGKSWGGQTQLRAAQQRPDALKAIVPVLPGVNHYEDGFYQGGVLYAGKISSWVWFHTLQSMPPTRRDGSGRWADVWDEHLEALETHTPWLLNTLEHDTKDDHWREKHISLENLDVPMLLVGGHRDIHPQTNIDCYEAATGPKRLIQGPWRHTMPHRGRETAIDFRRQVVEWFDYFLKGKDNGALDHSPIEYWTERNGGGKVDEGSWRGTDQWPNANGRSPTTLEYSLSADGLVPTDKFEDGSFEIEYEYDHTVGIESMDHLVSRPIDTNGDDARSVTFETEPLNSPVEWTGTGYATIRFSATTREPIVAVRVVDVDPNGAASLVTYGYLQASHRNGHSDPEPLDPGVEYKIDIPLRPKSHVFERDHRIRIGLSGALFPMTLPPRDHGSFTFVSSSDEPSEIVFPGTVHNDSVEFDDEVSMDAPDEEIVPATSVHVMESTATWENVRNHYADDAMFSTASTKEIDLPHGAYMSVVQNNAISVSANDPETAVIETSASVSLEYDHEVVEVETSARITHELAQLQSSILVDGHPLFEKTWRR